MGIAYMFSDYVKALDAAGLSITSEDSANYPVTNLQNENVALCARTTAKVGIKIRVTLAAAASVQVLALLNHNLSGGTFDVYSYTASDFTTGQVAVASGVSVRALDVYSRAASAPAARLYWEVDLTNATSEDSYFEVGRLMAYDDWTALTETQDAEKPRGLGYINIINETPYGVRWVHKLAENRERWLLTWDRRLGAYLPSELRALFAAVNGNAHPFLFVPSTAAAACYCVYIEAVELEWSDVHGTALAEGAKLPLIEAVRGKA